jgi:hypothetical protein
MLLKSKIRKLRFARYLRVKTRDLTFIKYEDLIGLSREFSKQLNGYDCVVAIPRIGLVVGGVIANCLGLPLFIPDNLPKDQFQNILLIDDGCCSDKGTMSFFAKQIKPKTKASIFTSEKGSKFLDKYMVLIKEPVIYEWDLFHTHPPYIDNNIAFDIDGVLCHNPPNSITTKDYALNAKPYHLPNFEIGTIITGRPLSLNYITLDWLNDHNIKFRDIFFTDNKIKTLLNVVPSIYYESDYETAKILAEKTHIPIIAVDKMELIYK